MTARQRILAIRLLEKQAQNPEYAAGIGIQVRMVTGKKQDRIGGIDALISTFAAK